MGSARTISIAAVHTMRKAGSDDPRPSARTMASGNPISTVAMNTKMDSGSPPHASVGHRLEAEDTARHQQQENRRGGDPEHRDIAQPAHAEHERRGERERHHRERNGGAPLLGIRIQAEQDRAPVRVHDGPAGARGRGASPRLLGDEHAVDERPAHDFGQCVRCDREQHDREHDVGARRQHVLARANPEGGPRRGHRAPLRASARLYALPSTEMPKLMHR